MTVVADPNMVGLMLLASKKLFMGCTRKGLKTIWLDWAGSFAMQMMFQEVLRCGFENNKFPQQRACIAPIAPAKCENIAPSAVLPLRQEDSSVAEIKFPIVRNKSG